ncbi:glycosyltransferase family 4 protein [Iamia majanohamensis]|uniref:Glycosyltransferase family 4 protein n=1 Tax=Iamia majanohamensis TaxID=467976 RepID=A0AAE9YBB3_9ACTN|nr:glycosyltransferase family 4 protein [Iamia majanohamensis]WCO65867.1 glycosyltransferase family 4 protein [Iamia majanohamensis]
MSGGRPEVSRRWRLWVHALDRTGPPVLARTVARWLGDHRPADEVEVLAFRGGPLAADLDALGPVTVVLDDEEPWDAAAPNPERATVLRRRLEVLRPVDANLLVSVAAGQALPLVGAGVGPVVTWVVEVGEDLRWLDADVGLVERTDAWWAGSRASADELEHRGVAPGGCRLVPEMVAAPRAVTGEERQRCREALGAGPDDVVVLGAGIGTRRKGLDLFAEVAGLARAGDHRVRAAWLGGTSDPLHPRVAGECERLGRDDLRLLPAVPELEPWLAAADVFLHTARADAFPLVCLHAAAQGTPVVTFSGTGGTTEMLGPHLRGAPFPDTVALAEEVVALAATGERRRALGDDQRRWVSSRFLAPAAGPVVLRELDRVADGVVA